MSLNNKELGWLVTRLQEIGGCHDGDCKVIPPVGMHTNGGCRCLRNDLTAERVLNAYRTVIGRQKIMDARKDRPQ